MLEMEKLRIGACEQWERPSRLLNLLGFEFVGEYEEIFMFFYDILSLDSNIYLFDWIIKNLDLKNEHRKKN